MIGLYKTELVYPRGPWQSLEDVELATLEWVWWFNNHRLFGPHGHIPPAEYEALHSSPQMAQPEPLILNETSLRWSRRDSILFLGLAGDIPFGFRHCTSPVWLGRCSNA